MFAVPEHTVLTQPSAVPLSPTALVRAATVGGSFVPGPVPVGDPRAEVWISVVPPGASVAARRYDAAQGAFAVIAGTVEETARGTSRMLGPGQVRVFGPGYQHHLRNSADEPALAVHVQLHIARLAAHPSNS